MQKGGVALPWERPSSSSSSTRLKFPFLSPQNARTLIDHLATANSGCRDIEVFSTLSHSLDFFLLAPSCYELGPSPVTCRLLGKMLSDGTGGRADCPRMSIQIGSGPTFRILPHFFRDSGIQLGPTKWPNSQKPNWCSAVLTSLVATITNRREVCEQTVANLVLVAKNNETRQVFFLNYFLKRKHSAFYLYAHQETAMASL
ncbi:hypothetical protein C8R45DRAFT_438170 [Mycena sanguinolenta]|nr:hypothetical protein C8R45DRAFT_438170 [Mycena sanguinolenta]